jgi:hypothetical protein
MNQYDVVKVVAILDDRFAGNIATFQRNPEIGDTGTILEVYTDPRLAYEVECSDSNGITVWLEAMYPEELDLIWESTSSLPA